MGKNWAEADADVGETIDFLEFYSREALRLASATTPIQYPGERNELLYIPLGVGAVIPPWNFPFAIMAGMTAASIVTGNTVILKPSSDSPTIAAKFVEVLEEAGMPGGVVNFCPGSGATFGNAIVEHPKTRFIAFTGSKAVGLDIHERAAKTQAGADLDQADHSGDGRKGFDPGVRGCGCGCGGGWSGGVGFRVQRAEVLGVFAGDYRGADLRHLRGAAAGAGGTVDGGRSGGESYMGPVINKAALDSMLGYIEIGRKEGRLVAGGHAVDTPEGGYFLEPTVFADVAPDARIAQEEIFGPVLAVIKVESFEEGLKVANNTEYGLTGALYTADRGRIEPGAAGVPRGESLFQSQVHRRHGGGASVRRVQHERDGLEGGRAGLPVPVHPGQERGGEAVTGFEAEQIQAGMVTQIPFL